MQKQKTTKKLCVITSLVIIFPLFACTADMTSIEPINASELYDVIMENKTVWERDDMISGTLVDLDYDGIPEYLLTSMTYEKNVRNNNLTIFKLYGTTLKEIKIIEGLYANENYAELRAIVPYTDENGAKNWIIPYRVDSGEYWEYFLSAFDFCGENVGETVKFRSKIYRNDEWLSRDGYYGYPFLNTEFYIGGTEYRAPQDKLDEFQNKLDRLVERYENEVARLGMSYLPWDCGQIYMNPSQSEWEDKKMAFLNDLLSVEPAYNLFPDIINPEYIGLSFGDSWENKENIEPSLKKIVESYCSDGEYLKTADLFYDTFAPICKPVIYLYPAEPTDISVRVSFSSGGRFTCTYPDYGGGWNVTAYPGGTLINKADGLEYSYLYWEGEGYANWDFSSGFVVKGSDTAAFLREKLSYLGLIPREYNEFIVYWLPLMQNNAYNLITFQTEAYEENAKLYVSPEPDSISRVFMAYKPLESAVEIPEQELDQFERTGFSVIEWGGACAG